MTELILSFPVAGGMTLSAIGVQGPPGGGGGGGVPDGDKGGIVVTGSGTVWTVKPGSITDLMLGASAIALFAAASHTHTIANITGLQAALDGKAATTHTHVAADVTDFATATRGTVLTGYAAAGSRLALAASDTVIEAFNKIGKWLSDLAAIAFSGSASDLTSGTLPAARFDDTAHGARAGGTLHANAVAAGAAGFMTGADKTKLDGISGTNTGDVSLAGTPNYLTIAGQVITRALIDLASHVTGKLPWANIADMATGTLFYRKTAGSGAPETQTLATLKTDLGLTGTNTGDQTITLTGMVTGSGTGSFAASLGSFTKAQLDAAVSDGNVLYVGDVTSNATHTGDVTGSTALTLATVNANVGAFGSATQVATFTVNAKGLTTAAANVSISIPATAISDSTTAGRAVVTAATATAQTALFDVFTSGAKGLAPASGGGTSNFLRADGAWAAPAGGGGGSLIGDTDSASPFETALGFDAGVNTTGVNNTFIGYEAGKANTTGTGNTTVGHQSGLSLTTGSNNVAIGNGADASAPTVSNEITMGNASISRFRIPGAGIDNTSAALAGLTPSVDAGARDTYTLSTSGNTTFTFTGAPSTGQVGTFSLIITAGGAHTLTWPASVDWAGGIAPAAPASGETNIYTFMTINGGATWYGFLAGDAMA